MMNMSAIPSSASVVIALACIGGCGNVSESLTIGNWVESGEAIAPQAREKWDQWDYEVTPVSEGSGEPVTAGALVQIRAKDLGQGGKSSEDQHTFWLYTGRQRGGESLYRSSTYGYVEYLGSPRIRRALIGRRVGDIFLLHPPPEKEGKKLQEVVPFKALIGPLIARSPEVAEKAPPSRRSEAVWRTNHWALGQGAKRFLLEIKIVKVCNALLYKRTDRLDQWGKIVNLQNVEGRHYSDSRSGALTLLALEAQCAGSAPIRLQAGPYYSEQYQRRPGELWQWERSYMRTSKQAITSPLSDDYYDFRSGRIDSSRAPRDDSMK